MIEVRPRRHRTAARRLLCALALAGLTGCVSHGPSTAYRFTLTLEDHGKQYTGSSVVQINPTMSYDLSSQRSYQANLRGTATFVQLPGSEVAAALLGSWGSANAPEPFLYLKPGGAPVHLTSDQWPSIAVFRDAAKPNSAYYLFDNGHGYGDNSHIRVTDAVVQEVVAAPTFQVPASMSWLSALKTPNLNIADGSGHCILPNPCIFRLQLMEGE